jgi:hypothetical protein
LAPGRKRTARPGARGSLSTTLQEVPGMARLIRMDGTGHTTLAEWTAADDEAFAGAVEEFRSQTELGWIGTVPEGPGKATHVRELPREADLVIMRRPIAGG